MQTILLPLSQWFSEPFFLLKHWLMLRLECIEPVWIGCRSSVLWHLAQWGGGPSEPGCCKDFQLSVWKCFEMCHQTVDMNVNVVMQSPPSAFSPCGPPQKCVRLSNWALPVPYRALVLFWVLLGGCVYWLFLLCARGEVLSWGGVLDDRGAVCRLAPKCKVLPEDKRSGDVQEVITGFRVQINWGCRLEFYMVRCGIATPYPLWLMVFPYPFRLCTWTRGPL